MSDENMHDRVLLVTEDLQAGSIWTHALSRRGVDVVLVESAEDALRRWAEEAFELVIVDIYNRQLDGIALCRHLRTEVDEPILLLTPTRDEAHLLEAYQAGVDECIAKPVSPVVLVAKVLAWLRSARAIPAGPAGRKPVIGPAPVVELASPPPLASPAAHRRDSPSPGPQSARNCDP